jgi:hypothetical protein
VANLQSGRPASLAAAGLGQAARGKAPALPGTAVRSGGARRTRGRASIPAGQLAAGAGRADAGAAIEGHGTGASEGSARACDRAPSTRIARRRKVAALVGLLASLAVGLALGRVRAAKHALGDGPAGAGAAIVVRLAALVLAETATRTLAASVGATHPGTAVLVLATALGDDLAARQGLAGGDTFWRRLTQPRAAIGRAAAGLAGHAATAEEQAARRTSGDATPAAAAVAIGCTHLPGHAAPGWRLRALAARAFAGTAIAADGTDATGLHADAAPANPGSAAEGATGTGATADQPVAGAAASGGAGQLSGPILCAHIRAAVLGPRTGDALACAHRVATGAAGAGPGTTVAVGGAGGAVARAQGERGYVGQLDVTHAARGQEGRTEEKPGALRMVGHRPA